MNEENGRKRLLWALVVINAIAGVVWVLGSFGVMTNEEGINLLYLAIGLINLIASVIWLRNARSS